MLLARDKIGIDANRPLDPQSGTLAPQVADPTIIADTGAGWVRLNFVVAPWSSPDDNTQHAGRTWLESYTQIVRGFRAKGLQVYGLIGHETVGSDPGSSLSDAPPEGTPDHPWISQYAGIFAAVVRHFHQDVAVFESFNEPDNWRDGRRNWLHPGWFAILLQRVHDVVRRDPTIAHVRLVSGPVQGLSVNNNAGAAYLQAAYQEGKRRFGWGQPGIPIPFDGVGYHLYVVEEFKGHLSPQARQQELREVYERYMEGLRAVIRQEEGRDKPIYISELGWHSNRNPEEYQAETLQAALELILSDPSVQLGFWFCTQDFGPADGNTFYGLYRPGSFAPTARKPAFAAYKAICARPFGNGRPSNGLTNGGSGDHSQPVSPDKRPENRLDNRLVIRAVSLAAAELGQDRYSLFERGNLWSLFFDRAAPYAGPNIESLPGFSDQEREQIQRKLAALQAGGNQRRAQVTAAQLNLRQGPGTEHPILNSLFNGASLLVLQEQGEWLRVEANGQEGYVHSSFVTLADSAVTPGFLRERAELNAVPLAPPPTKLFAPQTLTTPGERLLGWIWNQFGRLLAALADELQIDPAVAVAVLAVESGGKPFASDGRMIIRFENHLFHHYWGKEHPDQFAQHFQFNRESGRTWEGHQWRPAADAPWQPQHLQSSSLDENQKGEWNSFNFASSLDARAARLAISMGAPQIMGFNYSSIGYEAVEQMFEAFAATAHAQFLGLFDFIKTDPKRLAALQQRDFRSFAASYNGTGQADLYSRLIQTNVDTFKQIASNQGGVSFSPGSSLEIDTGDISFLPPPWALITAPAPETATTSGIITTSETDETSATNATPTIKVPVSVFPPPSDPQETAGASAMDSNSTPIFVLDKDVQAAWVEHVRNGFENNNVMFKRILLGFMLPYYLTIAMYSVMFIVGIGLFVLAARTSTNAPGTALTFAGLSVLTFIAIFIRNPLRSLEENLQFITWLGFIYNTYWTQLLYMQDRKTVQQELRDATTAAVEDIERMIDKNVKLAAERAIFRLPQLNSNENGAGSGTSAPVTPLASPAEPLLAPSPQNPTPSHR